MMRNAFCQEPQAGQVQQGEGQPGRGSMAAMAGSFSAMMAQRTLPATAASIASSVCTRDSVTPDTGGLDAAGREMVFRSMGIAVPAVEFAEPIFSSNGSLDAIQSRCSHW